jgi:LysR family glycine cleavage system transcriptional activator
MSRLPPLVTLRAFDAAARHLNVRLAAEELNVTHGAVAQQIRALEAAMGVQLFERHARGLALTPNGRTLHPPVRRAFALIAGAVAAIEPMRDRDERSVTVTVTPSFATKWLIPRLGDFATYMPDVEVRVLASERVEAIGSRGAPDLAVRLTAPPFAPPVEATLLMNVDLFPVCAPALAAELTTLQDLAHVTLLHDGHSHWPIWLERAGLAAGSTTSRRFNQTALALDAALDGQGVAIAPAPLVLDDLKRGRLVAPFGASETLRSEQAFYVIMPGTARIRPAVSAFRDWLLRAAAE